MESKHCCYCAFVYLINNESHNGDNQSRRTYFTGNIMNCKQNRHNEGHIDKQIRVNRAILNI